MGGGEGGRNARYEHLTLLALALFCCLHKEMLFLVLFLVSSRYEACVVDPRVDICDCVARLGILVARKLSLFLMIESFAN